MPVEVQVVLLWTVQHGYLDEVPVPRVKEYQTRFVEHLTVSCASLLKRIATEASISEELTAELAAAAESFKAVWA
jgi:F-type H+-transporting ATPase subunit alpha